MKPITIRSLLETIKEQEWKEKLKDRAFLVRLGVNVIVFFTLIFLLILPTLESRRELKVKLANIQHQIRLAQINISNLPRLKKNERLYRDKIEAIEKVLWPETEVADVIGVLSELARESNLIITGSEPVEYPEELPENFGNFYDIKMIRLECEGDYHAFGAFMSKIKSYERLIKIVRFVVVPLEGMDVEKIQVSVAVFSLAGGSS